MDRWGVLYGRMVAAQNGLVGRLGWGPAAAAVGQRLGLRWWAWWDRTHGDGADEYRRANGLYGM